MVVASIKAYSKSGLRASSCDCRNAALDTFLNSAACTLYCAGTCSRTTVSRSDIVAAQQSRMQQTTRGIA